MQITIWGCSVALWGCRVAQWLAHWTVDPSPGFDSHPVIPPPPPRAAQEQELPLSEVGPSPG